MARRGSPSGFAQQRVKGNKAPSTPGKDMSVAYGSTDREDQDASAGNRNAGSFNVAQSSTKGAKVSSKEGRNRTPNKSGYARGGK